MSEGLRWAIENGELDKVKQLVKEEKVDVNKPFENGRMPLHVAADYGQDKVVEFLLTQGADVNALDKYKMTPLLTAIYEGHLSVVKLLVAKGANKSLKAPDGKSYKECATDDAIKKLL